MITPVWNEEAWLLGCFASIRGQSLQPRGWTIVDSGSTDGTVRISRDLAASHEQINLIDLSSGARPGRAGQISRALNDAIRSLDAIPHFIAKVDADVSFEACFFEGLERAFLEDPMLGIASGRQYEFIRGRWREQRVTGTMVPAPVRVYRRQCLGDVFPLDECMGWDGIDHVKAAVHGWRTAVATDVAFYHHRRVGMRDGRRRYWASEGAAAYSRGYRPTYLLARAFYRSCSEPAAGALLYGYVFGALRGDPVVVDGEVRNRIRDAQRLRNLPTRIRETFGL